jgi:hypothetical protein
MIRTTLFLPPSLHQRLLLISKQQDKTFAEFARDLFTRFLDAEEQRSIERIYQAMDRINGVGRRDITDGSTSVNETLYGEKGAWRGSDQ